MPNPRWLVGFLMHGTLVFAQSSTHGTAVALVRTNEELVVAADSRVTNERRERKPDTCKILKSSGKIYFSLIGQANAGDDDFRLLINGLLRSRGELGTR